MKEELNLDELEEFDLTKAEYEVLACGIDKDGNYTGHEELVATEKNSALAEEYAARFYDNPQMFPATLERLGTHDEVFAIEIAVETVLETEPDYFENVETIYRRRIQVKEN